jgi:hypothetical protein
MEPPIGIMGLGGIWRAICMQIELSTHAANGLTENDFIVAAKIDVLPVRLKSFEEE